MEMERNLSRPSQPILPIGLEQANSVRQNGPQDLSQNEMNLSMDLEEHKAGFPTIHVNENPIPSKDFLSSRIQMLDKKGTDLLKQKYGDSGYAL